MSKLIPIQVVVSGATPFPIDMLRYDGCFPLSEGDSNLIINSMKDDSIRRFVILMRPHGFKSWKPSYAKWKYYGWEVVETREKKGYPNE